jgi:hypothetical protein
VDKFVNIGGSPAEVDMSECAILEVPVNIRIHLHSFASFSIYMHSLPPPHTSSAVTFHIQYTMQE